MAVQSSTSRLAYKANRSRPHGTSIADSESSKSCRQFTRVQCQGLIDNPSPANAFFAILSFAMAALVAHHTRRGDTYQNVILTGGFISALGVLSVRQSLGLDMTFEQGLRTILPASLIVSSTVSVVAHSMPPFKSCMSQNSTMEGETSQLDSVRDRKNLQEPLQKRVAGL